MDDNGAGSVEPVAGWVAAARHVVALTGAGVSTASGIPDFRGPQGLWTRDPDAVRLARIDAYLSDPEVRRRAWQWRLETRPSQLEPNPAHHALVDLERAGRLDVLVTQNVDGLHQRAGSDPDRVVEVHGTATQIGCLDCRERWPSDEVLERVRAGEADPRCERCGGILKSATISFGQSLEPETLRRAEAAARTAEVLIAAGTTLSVYPVAAMPRIAAGNGARIVVVNGEPTEQDGLGDAVLRGDVGEVLTALAGQVRDRLPT